MKGIPTSEWSVWQLYYKGDRVISNFGMKGSESLGVGRLGDASYPS